MRRAAQCTSRRERPTVVETFLWDKTVHFANRLRSREPDCAHKRKTLGGHNRLESDKRLNELDAVEIQAACIETSHSRGMDSVPSTLPYLNESAPGADVERRRSYSRLVDKPISALWHSQEEI